MTSHQNHDPALFHNIEDHENNTIFHREDDHDHDDDHDDILQRHVDHDPDYDNDNDIDINIDSDRNDHDHEDLVDFDEDDAFVTTALPTRTAAAAAAATVLSSSLSLSSSSSSLSSRIQILQTQNKEQFENEILDQEEYPNDYHYNTTSRNIHNHHHHHHHHHDEEDYADVMSEFMVERDNEEEEVFLDDDLEQKAYVQMILQLTESIGDNIHLREQQQQQQLQQQQQQQHLDHDEMNIDHDDHHHDDDGGRSTHHERLLRHRQYQYQEALYRKLQEADTTAEILALTSSQSSFSQNHGSNRSNRRNSSGLDFLSGSFHERQSKLRTFLGELQDDDIYHNDSDDDFNHSNHSDKNSTNKNKMERQQSRRSSLQHRRQGRQRDRHRRSHNNNNNNNNTVRLLQPSSLYQQTPKQPTNTPSTTTNNNPTIDLPAPGAYFVTGVNTNEDDDNENPTATVNASLYMSEEFSVHENDDNDDHHDNHHDNHNNNHHDDLLNDSQPEIFTEFAEVKLVSDVEKKEKLQRRLCCGMVLGAIVLISLGVGLLLGLPQNNNNNDSSSSGDATTLSNDSPTSAPTTPICVLDDIYETCQTSDTTSFPLRQLPNCVVSAYNTIKPMYTFDVFPEIEIATDALSCQPYNLALLSLAVNYIKSDGGGEISRTKFILHTLYFATNGHDWSQSSVQNHNWLSSKSECIWEDVICNEDGNVAQLLLGSKRLVGTIPTIIGLLDTLEILDVNGNQLTSTIPSELAQLSGLRNLILSDNSFDSGPIPSFLFNMTNLWTLILSNTQRTGPLPGNLLADMTNLQGLSLENNEFTGGIPTELFSLSLSRLILNQNNWDTTLPTEIGHMVSLVWFECSRCGLTGSMPTEIGFLTNLGSFIFDYNDMTGYIPEEVCLLWIESTSLKLFGSLENSGRSECSTSQSSFYGGLSCPTRLCCRTCPALYTGS